MSFSELWGIEEETGLNRSEEGLCLEGEICGYPVVLLDIPDKREYLLTVFFKALASREEELTSGISSLIEALPKNAVIGRRNELRYQQIRFSAPLLYQENIEQLADFTISVCKLADELDLPIENFDKKSDMSIAFPVQKPDSEKTKRTKKPKNAVSKRFDKYSIRGFIGALIGGGAMTVLSSMITDTSPSNIGGMLAGWSAGAFIALITLADYTFLAKKLDIFGTLCCSAITAAGCFISGYLTILRALTNKMRILAPEVTVNHTMKNWSFYQILFPDATADFPIVLLKYFFTAVVASVIFYTFYFRRHQAIMYSEGGDIMPDEGKEKKKTKIR